MSLHFCVMGMMMIIRLFAAEGIVLHDAVFQVERTVILFQDVLVVTLVVINVYVGVIDVFLEVELVEDDGLTLTLRHRLVGGPPVVGLLLPALVVVLPPAATAPLAATPAATALTTTTLTTAGHIALSLLVLLLFVTTTQQLFLQETVLFIPVRLLTLLLLLLVTVLFATMTRRPRGTLLVALVLLTLPSLVVAFFGG